MTRYKYRAKKGPNDFIDGAIEALSDKEAVEKLSRMGYIPIRMRAAKEKDNDGPAKAGSFFNRPLNRLKPRQITIFSRQLASLLKSGLPILKALNIISEQSENPRLKNVLQDIHNAVKDGVAFSSALSRFPKLFSFLYIAMIQAGENTGQLSESLLRIADYRARQEEIFSRFRMALAYPVLMMSVGLATVVFMLTFVMPRLMRIYVNMGQDLPLPTRILIAVSNGIRQWWFWIVLILLTAVLVIMRQAKTKTGRLSLSLLRLHMPVFGKFILKAELSRFSRTLELLIKNGIPILKAIDTAIPVVQNEVIKNHLKKSCKELKEGSSFGKSLKSSKLFPLFMSNLIIVGEESGRLEAALSEIADSYQRDTDEAIKMMSSLLEPVMILVMGLIVGFIVMAMLLPIFEINIMPV